MVEKSKFLGTNFSGSSLTFCSLEGASFDLVNLENAKLTGSHGYFFRTIGSNLTNTVLTGCNFHYGDFYGVIAKGAKFEQGKFIACRFQNTDLTNASFQGSNLKNTLFIDCILDGTIFTDVKGEYKFLWNTIDTFVCQTKNRQV